MNNNILLYPILSGGGTNIGPYRSPPIPILGVAKVPCQGANKLKNTCFIISHELYKTSKTSKTFRNH